MAQPNAHQPGKVYRGMVEEVFSHRNEIPSDATVELKVFESNVKTDIETSGFDGKSLADLIMEVGTVKGLPSDLSTNPEYMQGLGETKNLRTVE